MALALPLALAACAEPPNIAPQVSQEPSMYRSLATSGALVDARAELPEYFPAAAVD